MLLSVKQTAILHDAFLCLLLAFSSLLFSSLGNVHQDKSFHGISQGPNNPLIALKMGHWKLEIRGIYFCRKLFIRWRKCTVTYNVHHIQDVIQVLSEVYLTANPSRDCYHLTLLLPLTCRLLPPHMTNNPSHD